MRDLNYQLKKLCRQCREGSYATQVKRERMLTLMANQLHELGYRKMTPRSLTVTQFQLDKVRDEHVRMSLELQQAFGLRREEAMKFQPDFADQGDHIVLKGSWTKGGKGRVIPVRTEEQRDVLNRARRLAGFGSLIPSNRNYVHQMRVYEGNTLRAGLSRMHGLRHTYAQNRYEEQTGWKCPAASGTESRFLTSKQREIDHEARLTISRELGHEREAVTGAYLGR